MYIAVHLTRVTLDGIQRVKNPNKTIYKINTQKQKNNRNFQKKNQYSVSIFSDSGAGKPQLSTVTIYPVFQISMTRPQTELEHNIPFLQAFVSD